MARGTAVGLEGGEGSGLAGRRQLLDEEGAAGCQGLYMGECRGSGGGMAVEVDHDLDPVADRLAESPHQSGHMLDLGRARRVAV